MLLRYHLRPDRTTSFVNTRGTRPAASYVLVFRPARKGSCFGPFRLFRASFARVFLHHAPPRTSHRLGCRPGRPGRGRSRASRTSNVRSTCSSDRENGDVNAAARAFRRHETWTDAALDANARRGSRGSPSTPCTKRGILCGKRGRSNRRGHLGLLIPSPAEVEGTNPDILVG